MQHETTDPQRSTGGSFPEIHRFHESRVGDAARESGKRALEPEKDLSGDGRWEGRDAIRARTIIEAKNLEHFPDEIMLQSYMEGRLMYPKYNSYPYWVEELSAPEDLHDLEPSSLAGFYSNLADFINHRVDLINLLPRSRSAEEIRQQRKYLDDYASLITRKNGAFQELVSSGSYPDQKDFSRSFVFNNLNIRLGDRSYDLSRSWGWAGDLMSNIRVEGPLFVSHATEAMANQMVACAGKELPLHYGIYLNPRINQTFEVANWLSDAFENENLLVISEIMNRAFEVSQRHHTSWHRIEGITVYCNRYHANRVLEIILECFKRNYDSFKDRPSLKLATPIAPGIAVASQAGWDVMGYSFSANRANIIDEAWKDFLSQESYAASTVSHQSIYAFRQVLETRLRKEGINPRNISFNDSSVAYDIL